MINVVDKASKLFNLRQSISINLNVLQRGIFNLFRLKLLVVDNYPTGTNHLLENIAANSSTITGSLFLRCLRASNIAAIGTTQRSPKHPCAMLIALRE